MGVWDDQTLNASMPIEDFGLNILNVMMEMMEMMMMMMEMMMMEMMIMMEMTQEDLHVFTLLAGSSHHCSNTNLPSASC